MDEKETSVPAESAAAEKQQKKKGQSAVSARSILALTVTILLVVLASMAFVFRDRLTGEGLRSVFRRETAASVQSDAFTYELGTGQVFAAAGNGLAVASSSALELLDAAGETVFKVLVSYDSPAVFASEKSALFCDLGGTGCVLAGMDGESTALRAEGDLITASMNAGGWFAIVTDAVGYKGLVSVYDNAGALKYEWWSGSGYVLKALVSPDNRLLAALTAESGGGKLHIFRLDSEEEQASAAFENELPFDLSFLGNDTLCAVSEDALSFVSAGNGAVKSRYELGENYLLDYDLGSQNFVAVCASPYRTGGGAVETLDRDGKVLGHLETARDVTGLSASGRQLLVMTSGGVAVCGQDLSVQHETEALMTAKKAILCPDGSVLLLSAYAAEKLKY